MPQKKLIDALTSIHHRVSFLETHGNGQESFTPELYLTYEQVLAMHEHMKENLQAHGLQSLVCDFRYIQENTQDMTLDVFQR